MNDGGWISHSYSMRATAPEVLHDHETGDVILYLLGLNVSVTIPKDEAVRVAHEILAEQNTGTERDG